MLDEDSLGSVSCRDCGQWIQGMSSPAGQTCPFCGSKRLSLVVTPAPAVMRISTYAPTVVIGSSEEEYVPPQASSILLQAVIIPGPKTPEGSLITAVAPAWQAIIALLEKDWSLAFQIGDRKWEEIIAASYDEAGFDEVTLTPRSGDLGRDVIAVRRGHFGVRFIDQVKAYGPGKLVTADDVRALFGVLSADPKANKGIVTTTAEFAPKIESDALLAPFFPQRLELVDGKRLITKLGDIARGQPDGQRLQ